MRIISIIKARLSAPAAPAAAVAPGIALGIALGLAGLSGPVAADPPVVVELYTSQGCSSCPPADELLRRLSERDDVIPLALHVDYWDYIGWEDTFGQKQFTRRQKGYARAAGKRMVYTPQMVIGGHDHVVGTKPAKVERLISRHKAQDEGITLKARREGDLVRIRATAEKPYPRPLWVQIVRVKPQATVNIRRGENAGKSITYSNIVTDWRRLDPWDTQAPLEVEAAVPGDDEVVVILQSPDFGPILAAARAGQ